MNTISLPAQLPGVLNLTAVNQQLKAHEAQLDWQAVTAVESKSFSQLLSGLDISNHADELGLETIVSDTVLDAIEAYFEQAEALVKPPKKKAPNADSFVQPALWQQIEAPIFDPPPAELFLPATEPSISEVSETPERILKPLTPYQIRAELETKIIKDLLGPAEGDYEEVDERSVRDRYLVGLLAPRERHQRQLEELPELATPLETMRKESPEDGKPDGKEAASQTIFPSSFGMTFCVSHQATAFVVSAGWGQYKRADSEAPKSANDVAKKVWRRYPISDHSPAIPLKSGPIEDWKIDADYEVVVRGQIREQTDSWIVSLFLVNNQKETAKLADSTWLFQPKLSVQSVDEAPVFLKRVHRRPTDHKLDPAYYGEEQMMNMLYRKQVEFAVGHGVGVHATPTPDDVTKAIQLETAVVPAYEVPQSTAPDIDEEPKLGSLILDMKQLAALSPEAIPDALRALPTAYADWIQVQQARLGDSAEGLESFGESAKTALKNCDRALTRIRAGIKTLASNPQAAQAFLFMNRAMYEQRVHSIYARSRRQGEDTQLSAVEASPHRWRPFQLAFILLNLPSTTDLSHPDRCDPTKAIADLLWFPTGGGKTEAYLGLAAYTIGLRRLQGTLSGRSGAVGVAVLMRYTLRLLTLQQFQRATTLICACEVIRRESPETWGDEPFRIGLWVGMKTTPNRTTDSESFIKSLKKDGPPKGGGSPHQLTSCPWCGTLIDEGKNIKVDPYKKGAGRTLVHCGDILGQCLFSKRQSPKEGIPIIVVDEEIYRRLPTLLIATVDKFAQMPWKGETQMLFGQVNGYCERHGYCSPEIEDEATHRAQPGWSATKTKTINPLRPPDLIIQDELHLISGPLGTLVGLYETAIDKLASWEVNGKTVRPKVIASTATVRQAQSQIHDLFLRQVNVFPPQGLDISDNFFSRQRVPSAMSPGRRYLGICATGRRLKAATIRVYTAILSASKAMYDQGGDRVDPWMTLVGYFNSMRELGGTRRLVDDDIQQRLTKMDQRGLARRYDLSVEELTSRKSSTDIPKILDRMETPYSPTKTPKKEAHIDVLLATNMISVGVDVGRLGIMAVTGQPKTTAEYIQSTSRVGRAHPGLVITIFNWARPRDLSHYERFEHYHATFYQHVESLSLTPFSPGATDRGLAALLVSLIRLSKEEYNSNKRARRIQRSDPSVQDAIQTIVERARHVSDDPTVRDFVHRELSARLDYWLAQAENAEGGQELAYRPEKDGVTVGLLEKPGADGLKPFTCLNSLRNVEPTIGLILNSAVPEDSLEHPPQPMPTTISTD